MNKQPSMSYKPYGNKSSNLRTVKFLKQVSQKELLDRAKEEKATGEKYESEGFVEQGEQEEEHAKFFEEKAKGKEKSGYQIASSEISPKEKALYHNGEALKELKKENTNWKAVRYHQGQAKRYARMKNFLVPRKNKQSKIKSDSENIESADYMAKEYDSL